MSPTMPKNKNAAPPAAKCAGRRPQTVNAGPRAVVFSLAEGV
ncbi:MAG TPA: hypothetical protein VGF45_12030 [Polyangia bacterium]